MAAPLLFISGIATVTAFQNGYQPPQHFVAFHHQRSNLATVATSKPLASSRALIFPSPPLPPQHSSLLTLTLQISPETIAATLVVVTAGTAGTYWWLAGTEERASQAQYDELVAADEARRRRRAERAHVDYREELWSEAELAVYDGTDPDGPLLLAANGDVFNVWKSRHLYGPGCEYGIMGGRDATRFLAKNSLEEESVEGRTKPLNVAERASLEGWYWTLKNKYDVVGRLEGY